MNTLVKQKMPVWFWVVAILGCGWNIFGDVQFIQSVRATQESFIAMGMTEAQAQTMLTYPIWMTVAFAIGTFGGLAGTILLLLKKRIATPVFIASLIGYVILYIGDITEGVFAAIGSQQVIILTTVVLVAAFLLWVSKHFEKQNKLV